MSRYEAEKKAKAEYEDCRLRYKLDLSVKDFADRNEKNLKKMQEVLDAVGIWLDLEDDEIRLAINPEKYMRVTNRGAGRREKYVWKSDNYKEGTYKYSDIVLMMQTMKDQDIADHLGMPIATYYRHKKKLKESRYYQNLDAERLRDQEYLESVELNLSF